MNSNELIVFVAHMDDLEFSCLGYLLRNQKKYNTIKLVTATTWLEKEEVHAKNHHIIKHELLENFKQVQIINLDYPQRTLQTNFDLVKDSFYKCIDFDSDFDILTHDKNDAHSDHIAVNNVAYGLYKYAKQFITFYSPSSVNFIPNYYIELAENENELKRKLLTNYDFSKEQSYSKRGTYFRRDYTDIASVYSMENFVGNEMKYCEIYKIHKWVEQIDDK